MREIPFAQVQPDPLDRVQFWRSGGQRQQRDMTRHAQGPLVMPARLIEDQGRRAPAARGAAPSAPGTPPLCPHPPAAAPARRSRPCPAGRRRTGTNSCSADRPRRAGASRARTRCAWSALSSPRTRVGAARQDAARRWPAAARGAAFLKAACAAGSPFGCEGRAFWRERCRRPSRPDSPHRLVVHAIPALDVRAQIDQTPGANPVALRRRPAQNVRLERGLLPRAQPLGAPRARLVVKPRGARRVEAQHRIAQRLPLHPGQAAASARGMPSSALATARSRRAARRSGSRPASRRSSEGE